MMARLATNAEAVAAWEGQREIRVLCLIDSLGTGGSERSLAELLGPLTREGVRPVVAVFKRWPEGVEQQVLDAGFDVRFVRARSKLGRIRAVRRLIRRERPDIVHTTLAESDMIGRFAAAGLGMPLLTSLVNTTYDPVRLRDPNVRATRLRLARLIDGWTARHLTSHFHAITHAVRDAAVRDLGVRPERITVIERGRDPARLAVPSPDRRRAARLKLGLSDADEVLVNVGRQEFQKGQRYLVEAAADLIQLRPRAVVLVAGRQGHASGDLVRLVRKKGLSERVRFLGFREDIPDFLAAADVFVFPSLYEGLGGALIEAMAAGLPIVSSDLAATREILQPGHNAILVPPASSSHMAAAVFRLLTEERTRREFGGRSRSIFEQRFTLEGSVRRIVAMYERLVEDRGRKDA